MIPFQVDQSWYERYWWHDPAPDRTASRAYKSNRERLLRTADAMKVAINPFVGIVLAALRLRRSSTHEGSLAPISPNELGHDGDTELAADRALS
jgi:hypothetical protein